MVIFRGEVLVLTVLSQTSINHHTHSCSEIKMLHRAALWFRCKYLSKSHVLCHRWTLIFHFVCKIETRYKSIPKCSSTKKRKHQVSDWQPDLTPCDIKSVRTTKVPSRLREWRTSKTKPWLNFKNLNFQKRLTWKNVFVSKFAPNVSICQWFCVRLKLLRHQLSCRIRKSQPTITPSLLPA